MLSPRRNHGERRPQQANAHDPLWFAVVDTAQGGLVVEGGFKRSIDAQRFALELYKALSFVRPTKPEDLQGSGGADGV